MLGTQLIALAIMLFMAAVNWLILSRIDVWGSPFKTVVRDIPVQDKEVGSVWREGLPGKTRTYARSRYRREKDEIPLTQAEQQWQAAKRGLATVTFLYLLNLGMLWALTRLGPVSGGVNGLVKQFGGNLSVAAAGLLGAFLVLFIVSVFAFRVIMRKS
ncbi:MAG TPA: hypothetical protein VFW94_07820 [Candidatus Acidoferrales bacterium]|nr:hypothetical protein [Candidatus Acidoferrales bacterium]